MSRQVVTVPPTKTFREIGDIIFGKQFAHKFSSVPVVDKNKKLLGIVTEKDLLRRVYPSQSEVIENFFEASKFLEMEDRIHGVEKLTARQIMGKHPVTTTAETPLMKAGSLMLTANKRRLPVINEQGKLVGVISQGDIFRAIFSHLSKKHPRRR